MERSKGTKVHPVLYRQRFFFRAKKSKVLLIFSLETLNTRVKNQEHTQTYWNRYVLKKCSSNVGLVPFIHLCKFVCFLDRNWSRRTTCLSSVVASDIAGYGIFGLAGFVQSRNNRSETESELSDIKVYTIDVVFG
jgi:hypothetical protein